MSGGADSDVAGRAAADVSSGSSWSGAVDITSATGGADVDQVLPHLVGLRLKMGLSC